MRRTGLLAAMVALMAGCSTPVAGVPSPAPTTAPARPRDVHLAGIDPCTLLTAAQRSQLGLGQPPHLDRGPSPFFNGGVTALCIVRGDEPRAVAVGIELSTTGGIELYTDRKLDATVTRMTVRGFPAALEVPTGFTDFCSVGIDLAPGEAMDVQYADDGRKPPVPQTDLCAGARQVADIVVANLLATR